MYSIAIVVMYLLGALFFAGMALRSYKISTVKINISELPFGEKKKVKRYMLASEILFALSPMVAMLWMAVVVYIGIDMANSAVAAKSVLAILLLALFSISYSIAYDNKAQKITNEKAQLSGAA